FAETERIARETLGFHPGSVPVRCQIVTALLQQHKFAEADRELAQLLEDQPLTLRLIATQAALYAAEGRTSDALTLLRRHDIEKRKPSVAGRIHAMCGNRDEAFRCFELAVRAHDPDVPYATMGPEFTRLRSDPRARKILDAIRTL